MTSTTLAPAGVQASTVRWRIFLVIFALVVINLVDRVALSIAMPTIALEFGLSATMQGLILSSFFWSYAALQLPSGWLIDRFGPRVMVTAATLLWGIFQSLAVVASGGLSLLLTRVGLGGAEAPLFPAGGKLNASWLSPGERGRGAVIMDCGGPLGAAIGGIVISWLILTLGSWRLAFLLAGLVTIGMGILSWWYLRDRPEDHAGVNAAELAQIRASGPAKAGTAEAPRHLSRRSLAALCIGRFGWATVFFGLITWGPSYLSAARGMDLKAMGYATFVIFLCGAAGSLTGGFLADALVNRGYRRGRVAKTMLALSGLVAALSLLALPRVVDPVHAVLLLSVTAFFLLWGSLYWSFPPVLAPADKVGFVGGAMNCAGSISGIIIPVLIGWILDVSNQSYGSVLAFFAAAAGLYVVATLLIDLGGRRPTVAEATR
ncbi:MFS transporter [Aureimonas sp. AU12]|uniref:MFS transporter n=1 Tax=Aureimonas sp. AU12 TaxID=1638161 RepID=UPI0007825997|nr:MFS transporter [Aureimonas sp. AU12]